MPPEHLTEMAELAGGFIHEIKNHVSTLNLNLQLLAEDFAEPQTPRERRAKQRIDRVRNQAEKLVEVSNDFLRFVRCRPSRPSPTPRRRGRRDGGLLRPHRQGGQHRRPAVPASRGAAVRLDRDLFQQALLNLMLNAEQAMPDGGEMVLQTRSDGETGLPGRDRHREGD